MKQALFFLLALLLLTATGFASVGEGFDLDAQLDALGRDELTGAVPEEARELLADAGVDGLSVGELLQLTPGDFFATVWRVARRELARPLGTLGMVVAVAVLAAMLGGLGGASTAESLSGVFSVVAVLALLAAVVRPIFDCVTGTSEAVENASAFMLTYIPVFSAALFANGQPATGAAYNLFLFSTCQAASRVVAGTIVPLLGIYLAVSVVGALVPELGVDSAAKSIRSIVSWALGLLVTVFVGLLSIQTMVSGSADGVAARATRFLLGSFVPVVGGVLSEAISTARGCLRLIKTSVGVYGILAAAFVFLPVLIRALSWYFVTGVAAVAGDILGVRPVSAVMRSCNGALGILIAVVLSFALLIIVSTAVVLVVVGG